MTLTRLLAVMGVECNRDLGAEKKPLRLICALSLQCSVALWRGAVTAVVTKDIFVLVYVLAGCPVAERQGPIFQWLAIGHHVFGT